MHTCTGIYYNVPINVCFFIFDICTLFSGALGSVLALSAAGQRKRTGPPVHYGASLGPGRALWRVLWAFKVEKSGKYHGVTFRGAAVEPSKTIIIL